MYGAIHESSIQRTALELGDPFSEPTQIIFADEYESTLPTQIIFALPQASPPFQVLPSFQVMMLPTQIIFALAHEPSEPTQIILAVLHVALAAVKPCMSLDHDMPPTQIIFAPE